MPGDSHQQVRDLLGLLQKIGSDILKLRLASLPQPNLLMVLERAGELRQALRQGIKKIRHDRQQAGVTRLGAVQLPDRMVAAVRPLFKSLYHLRMAVTADILVLENFLHPKHFYRGLYYKKKLLRELSARFEEAQSTLPVDAVLTGYAPQILEMGSELGKLKAAYVQLNKFTESKVASYYKKLESIFFVLEKDHDLSELNKSVTFSLRAIAYTHIASSGFFDNAFYLSQIPDKAESLNDGIKHYLTAKSVYAPNRYFDERFYTTAHPEVRKLRYKGLEHFARYGEALRYDPCPEFDTAYYLRSNDDVLDANVSPIRHFLQHGLLEGRPPAAKAGSFFVGRYLDAADISLAFVGEPDPVEAPAWNAIRLRCATRPGRRVTNIAADCWTGEEPGIAAFVVGSATTPRLHGQILRAVTHSGGLLVYLGSNPQGDLLPLMEQPDLPLERVCAITPNYDQFIRWQEREQPLRLHYYGFSDDDDALPFVEALLARLANRPAFAPRRFVPAAEGNPEQPLISVVSIIYKKSKEMLAFLESLNRQDLARPYEVILVDDASPDDTVHVIQQWLEKKKQTGRLNKFMHVSIHCNAINSGNCVSRNKGISIAQARIVLVVDGDVVLSPSSLTEHLLAYRCEDCDAVIGFFEFNMNFDFVFHWLSACDINPAIVHAKILSADGFLVKSIGMRFSYDSIYNFVTRNVSFKKEAFANDFFDIRFNYSRSKDSGYGEEDHELGARLYFSGKKIKFIESSVAVHIRHVDNSYNANKAIANLRCWNRLIAKYPELTLVDRQYYQWRTFDLLQKSASCKDAPEFKEAFALYAHKSRPSVRINASKPLNILVYAPYTPHIYELSKLGRHRFTLVSNIGTKYCNGCDYRQRPLPCNIEFIPLEKINQRQFDLAILPFDEHVLDYNYYDTMHHDDDNTLITMLKLTDGLPRLGFCLGSPQIHEQDGLDSPGVAGSAVAARLEALRTLLRDIPVVCPSHQAQREWGFLQSSVIWPGLSPMEFPPGTHRRAVCLTLREEDFEKQPAKTGRALLKKIEALVGKSNIEYCIPGVPRLDYPVDTQEWSIAMFQNYVRYIGEASIYLNTTTSCPLPLPRAEAMMTGVIPVTLRNHDVDMFIKNGVNGFFANSAEEMAEHVLWLLRHEHERERMSRNARLSAMDIFNIDRNLAAWSALVAKVM